MPFSLPEILLNYHNLFFSGIIVICYSVHENRLSLFWQILSNKNDIINLLHPFNNLKVLELHTGFEKNNVPGLAFLFRSSPTLHTLILKIINDFKTERRVSTINVILFDLPPCIYTHT